MDNRKVVPGQIYRHFKGNLYQIICVAHHSETEEALVVYQALYGEFGICARPYDMFISEVDREKYPKVEQKYRFEYVGQTGPLGMSDKKANEVKADEAKVSSDNVIVSNDVNTEKHNMNSKPVQAEEVDLEESIDPALLEFLNAKTYSQKKEIFSKMKKSADDKLLNDIAVSLDFVLPEGDITAKYEAIYSCINAHARFEVNRR